MEDINDFTAPEVKKRPDFLSVLCILSLIWEGFLSLCCLLVLCLTNLIFGAMQGFVDTDKYEQLSEVQKQAVEKIMNMGQGIFALLIGAFLLLTVISIIGIIKMWKLKRAGFYLYAVTNGILVVMNLVQLNVITAIIGIAFIAMYGVNLRHMKR